MARTRLIPLVVLTAAISPFVSPLRPAHAQQFVQETTTRLPQPDPLEYTNQVAVEDIDGDGDLDLAFANGSGYSGPGTQQLLRILINDGTGVFADESILRTGGITGYSRDVEFGDVDGDGDPDAIIANDYNTQPRLLMNDGDGFFTDETGSRLPTMNLGSSHAAFGDVDNDGDLDLWLTNGGSSRFGQGQAQLWINDGDGFFTNGTSTHLPSQLVDSPMDAIFGDVDGDFFLDMVEGHRDVQSRLYRNQGDGTFLDITSGNLPSDQSTYSYDLGDLDSDGDLDLLGINSAVGSSREVLFINDGSGTFTNQTTSFLPIGSNPAIDDNDSKFFDVDNDGDLDFIIGSLGSTERICVQGPTGIYAYSSGLISPSSDSTMDVEVGDFNGDGTLDVITGQGESGNFTNRIYMNNGPADTIAPIFPALEDLADTDDPTGPYVVRVKIRDGMTSDHNFFLQSAVLRYAVDGGSESEVPLVWSGGDVYRAEIPGAVGMVTYHAEATDFAGNTGMSDTASFSVTGSFERGDCNGDGGFDVADAVFLLAELFSGGPDPVCQDACDGNDDGGLDIADAVTILNTLFTGAGPLPAPSDCGLDPTADGLSCTTGSCP